MARWQHGLIVAALFAAGAWSWSAHLRSPSPLTDEAIYLRAFRHLLAGDSPYLEPGFLYPPPFAVIGAAALRRLGEPVLLAVLRHLNLAAACVAVWVAIGERVWPLAVRWAAATAVVTLSPLLGTGLGQGNLSYVAVALTLLGARAAIVRPRLAGAAIGLGLALKPLALPLTLVFLLAPVASGDDRRGLRTCAVTAWAVAGAVLMALGARFLPGMTSRLPGVPASPHNVSLSRALHCFGIDLPPALLGLAVVGATLLVLRRRELALPQLVAAGTVASALALPVVWPHTFTLTLPAQAGALERACVPSVWQRRIGWTRPALVLAAVASVHGSLGTGAYSADWPPATWGLLTLIPLVALAGLGVYAAGDEAPIN